MMRFAFLQIMLIAMDSTSRVSGRTEIRGADQDTQRAAHASNDISDRYLARKEARYFDLLMEFNEANDLTDPDCLKDVVEDEMPTLVFNFLLKNDMIAKVYKEEFQDDWDVDVISVQEAEIIEIVPGSDCKGNEECRKAELSTPYDNGPDSECLAGSECDRRLSDGTLRPTKPTRPTRPTASTRSSARTNSTKTANDTTTTTKTKAKAKNVNAKTTDAKNTNSKATARTKRWKKVRRKKRRYVIRTKVKCRLCYPDNQGAGLIGRHRISRKLSSRSGDNRNDHYNTYGYHNTHHGHHNTHGYQNSNGQHNARDHDHTSDKRNSSLRRRKEDDGSDSDDSSDKSGSGSDKSGSKDSGSRSGSEHHPRRRRRKHEGPKDSKSVKPTPDKPPKAKKVAKAAKTGKSAKVGKTAKGGTNIPLPRASDDNGYNSDGSEEDGGSGGGSGDEKEQQWVPAAGEIPYTPPLPNNDDSSQNNTQEGEVVTQGTLDKTSTANQNQDESTTDDSKNTVNGTVDDTTGNGSPVETKNTPDKDGAGEDTSDKDNSEGNEEEADNTETPTDQPTKDDFENTEQQTVFLSWVRSDDELLQNFQDNTGRTFTKELKKQCREFPTRGELIYLKRDNYYDY